MNMEAREHNAITQFERDLIKLLKEEYSFYQSLYVLLDKQRDMIKFNKDEKLLDLFADIQRCHRRIRQSGERIEAMKSGNPRIFRLASVSPDVRKMANSISTLIKKSMNLVSENEEYMTSRYARLKSELDELKNSHKILQYVKDAAPAPQFVDRKN